MTSVAGTFWVQAKTNGYITLGDVFEAVTLSFIWLGNIMLIFALAGTIVRKCEGRDFSDIVIWRRKR